MKIVEKIHSTSSQGVVAITGGGTEAIGELLRHGNGSKTLLEAIVPYDQESLKQFLRGVPDKFCSEQTARQMAMAAYLRAVELKKNSDISLFGVGASCSLVKENEREGRKHKIFVGIQTNEHTISYSVELKSGTREEQETTASEHILNAIASACSVVDRLPAKGDTLYTCSHGEEFADLFLGVKLAESVNRVIFPGSFAPFHDGHNEIVKAAYKYTKQPVTLEISVFNMDKPALDYREMEIRRSYIINNYNYKDIIFTNEPKITGKASLFKNSTFIVGIDTLLRIVNPKYYLNNDLDVSINYLEKQGIKFLVFPRIQDGKLIGENDFKVKLPDGMVTFIPGEFYIPTDCSSTKIRNESN